MSEQSDSGELIPCDLTAEPQVRVPMSPGWEDGFKSLTVASDPAWPLTVLQADPEPWSAAEVAEFERRWWLDGIRRRLRLVMAGETWIRAAHPYAFRSGEWARLTRVSEYRVRTCYYVTFEDGVMDYWARDAAEFGYEFFPPSQFTGLLDILKGRAG